MTKPYTTHTVAAQLRQEKALQFAKESLAKQGVTYPIYDSKLTAGQNHDALMAYAEKESMLVIQYLNEPSGPRPIVLDTTQKYKDWYK